MTSENPVSEGDPTPHAGHEADKQAGPSNPEIPPSSDSPRHPPSRHNGKIAHNQEKNWWDKSKPFVEAFGVILVAIYTAFTIKIYRANHDAAVAANRTLGEIQKQTNLMRQETIGTFAAVVPAEAPRPNTLAEDPALLRWQGLYVYFANVGKVPATNFVAGAILRRYSLPSFSPIGRPRSNHIGPLHVRPYEQMPTGIPGIPVDNPSISLDIDDFNKKDLYLLNQTKETVEVTGTASYENGFGEIVPESFCFMYLVTPHHVFGRSNDPYAPGTGGGGGSWGTCRDVKAVPPQIFGWKNPPNTNPKHQ